MPDYGDRVVVSGKLIDKIIPDAELLLPDEAPRLGKFRKLIAYSLWLGGEYPSVAALIEKRKQVEAKLNDECADWQRAITLPCWVTYGVRNPETDDRIIIYGRCPTIDTFIETEAHAGGRIGDSAEKFGRRLRQRLENANMRGWLYGEWFSKTQPLGQWAAIPRATIQTVLTEAQFTEAQDKGWEGVAE